MIGLIDYDLQTCQSSRLHPPNLEIMKLATYYKIEQQQFCRLIPIINNEDLTHYDEIYFFSEAESPPKIPEYFLRAKNVTYGGTAFTNGVYIPFKDELIDYTLPKVTIYKDYLKQCYQDGIKANVISHILDDTYYRQFAGKNKLPLPAIYPNKKLWVYDINFFQDGWREMIELANERKCSSINTIHPVICKTMSDYLDIRQQFKIARSNDVIIDFEIPLEETKYLFKEYKNFFLADITNSSNVYLKIGDTFSTNFQYYKDLIYKLNLLYCFWSNQIPIKLKFFPPHVGVNCNIINLLHAIELWANSKNRNWCINDKITRKKMKEPTLEYAEELIILKFYPKAAELFIQNYTDIAHRGFWRV